MLKVTLLLALAGLFSASVIYIDNQITKNRGGKKISLLKVIGLMFLLALSFMCLIAGAFFCIDILKEF